MKIQQHMEGVTPIHRPLHANDEEQQSVASSVVSRSKSRHLVVLNNLKKREEMWDTRFHLQHIPKYDVFSDKHQQNYQYQVMKEVKRNQIEFAPGRIRKKPGKDSQQPLNNQGAALYITEAESEKSVQSSVSNIQNRQIPIGGAKRQQQLPHQNPLMPHNAEQLKEAVKESFDALKATWEQLEIPTHHREVFVQCCKQITRDRAIDFIHRELEDLKKGDSFILNCMKAVKGRESCLQQLEEEIGQMEKVATNQHTAIDGIISKCSELLTHLRLLSINAVECISSWRNYLMEYLQQAAAKERQVMIIPYLFREQNYLVKMRTDSQRIQGSVLKDYFSFSAKPEYKIDPFLLSITDTSEQTDKQVQFISKNLKKRIDNCSQLLAEELLRVQEDEKFQQAQLKKPGYTRYGSKPPGGTNINNSQNVRKTSQNARPIPQKQVNPYQPNAISSGSARKGTTSSNSNYGSSSPQRLFGGEGSASKKSGQHQQQQYRPGDGDAYVAPQNPPIPSSSTLEQVRLSQGDISSPQNKQTDHSQQNHNKSASSIYQSVKLLPTHNQIPASTEQQLTQSNSSTTKPLPSQQQPQNHPTHSQAASSNEQVVATPKNASKQSDRNTASSGLLFPELEVDDLLEYTNKYLEKIDKQMQESVLNSTSEIRRRLHIEHDCGCMEYKVDGTTTGMAYYFTENSTQSRRITLMHISTLTRDYLDAFITLLVDYIFTHDNCEEIRMSLYHYEAEDGKFTTHKDVQTIFTSKGFKWKQVINDQYTRQRTTILSLRRPATIPVSVFPAQQDHILLHSVSTLQKESASASPAINSAATPKHAFDSSINTLACVSQMTPFNSSQIDQLKTSPNLGSVPEIALRLQRHKDKIAKNQDKLPKDQEKPFQFNDMKREIYKSKSQFTDSLAENKMIMQNTAHFNESQEISGSLCKLVLKWKGFSKCEYNRMNYLNIYPPLEQENQIMRGSSVKNSTVFILPTDDANTSVFVFEIGEQFNNDFRTNFTASVREVIKELKNTQPVEKQDILLPVFECNGSAVSHTGIDQYTLTESIFMSINYQHSLPRINNTIDLAKASKKIIIKAPFVFGLINNEIDEVLEVPYYSALIDKEHCVRL